MIQVDIAKKIKTYQGFELLRVNTVFNSQQVTQILGISGAGKTTFLKILAGLVHTETGLITVDDISWLDTGKQLWLEPQKRNVGFVFQDYALFPNMTVLQHLQYGSDDEKYIDQLLALGRMASFKQHRPRQLSGGQQQRLGILRALSTKPKVLLMDEPFSALDKALRADLIPELRKLIHQQKITCLVVTHEPFGEGGFADYTFEIN